MNGRHRATRRAAWTFPRGAAARRGLLFLLVAIAASGCAAPSGDAPSTGHPVVLLVSIDTLRADHLGCYGWEDAGTPVIDRLAAEGVRFAAAQTTAPVTLPAHTSMLTGRSLPAYGVLDNGTFRLSDRIPTLAEGFRERGYATGAFVSSPVLATRYGLGRGFDVYDDRISEATRAGVLHGEERLGPATAAQAVEWARTRQDRPLFLWVHYFEPHRPYQPPAELAERWPEDPYHGEVVAADRAVGELLDGLEAIGRGDNLLVAVVSDPTGRVSATTARTRTDASSTPPPWRCRSSSTDRPGGSLRRWWTSR